MNDLEFSFGLGLVLLLVALSLLFGLLQFRTLRKARQPGLDEHDRKYLRSQAVLRLCCSGLMLLLAALLVGSYFFEQGLQQITEQNRPRAPDTEEKAFLQDFTLYWIVTLLILFLFAVAAAFDIRSTLRYGLRKHRQLEQAHRAALAAQVQQHRERNGRKRGEG